MRVEVLISMVSEMTLEMKEVIGIWDFWKVRQRLLQVQEGRC